MNLILLSRDPAKLDQAKTDLTKEAGGAIDTVAVDLYDEAAVDAFIAQLHAERRHIRHLVNAAGAFNPLSFLEHGKTDYDKYLGINRAFFFITQAVAKNMKSNGGGSIVNIGSMWVHRRLPRCIVSRNAKRYTKQRGPFLWTTGTTRNAAGGITSSGLILLRPGGLALLRR